MLKNVIAVIVCGLLAAGCSKPESKEISSEIVLKKIIETTDFEDINIIDLTEIKNSQKYGISTDKIKDGFAASDIEGDDVDNIVVLRVNDDKDVDSIEESILAYINDMASAWENDDEENMKIENRVFKTIDKYVMLYIGDNPEEAKKTFENAVKA